MKITAACGILIKRPLIHCFDFLTPAWALYKKNTPQKISLCVRQFFVRKNNAHIIVNLGRHKSGRNGWWMCRHSVSLVLVAPLFIRHLLSKAHSAIFRVSTKVQQIPGWMGTRCLETPAIYLFISYSAGLLLQSFRSPRLP